MPRNALSNRTINLTKAPNLLMKIATNVGDWTDYYVHALTRAAQANSEYFTEVVFMQIYWLYHSLYYQQMVLYITFSHQSM